MPGYDSGLYDFALYDGGSIAPLGARGSQLVVEVLRSGPQWRDVTSSVRVGTVSYRRGYSPDSSNLDAGSLRLTFDNAGGEFSPRKSGSFISSAGRNVPIRVGLGSRPVGNAFRDVSVSQSTVTVNGPFDAMAAAGTQICLYAVSPVGNVTTPTGMTEAAETDGAYMTASINHLAIAANGVVNRTAAVSPNVTSYGAINVGLPGTWTYQSSASGTAGSGNGLAVNTSNGRYVFVGMAWSTDPAGILGPPQVNGPFAPEWVSVADSGVSTGPRAIGWWAYFPSGTYTVVVHGDLVDCDTAMFLYQSSDAPAYSPRFTGVVREWPVQWGKAGSDIAVPVEAQGGIYRGRQDALPMSPARALLGRNGLHYWPMEDEGGPGFAAATAGTPRLVATVDTATDDAPIYSTSTEFVGSSALPTFTDAGAYASLPPLAVGTGGVECAAFVRFPTTGTGAGANVLFMEFSGGNVNTFGVEYTSTTTLTLKWTYNDGTATATSAFSVAGLTGGGIDGKSVVLAFSGADTGGSVLGYGINVRDVTWNNGFPGTNIGGAATIATRVFGNLVGVRVGLETGTNATLMVNAPTVGHLVVGPSGKVSTDLMAIAATGGSQAGYHGWPRIVATPVPVSYSDKGSRFNALDTGPVPTGTMGDRLQKVSDTEQALFVDGAGHTGINALGRGVSESSVTAKDWVYTDKQLTDPLVPADDDALVRNRVTVRRPDPWGQASYEALTGTLGVAQVGPYSQEVDAFPNTVGATEDLAEWLVAQGTVDAQRWPELSVDWRAATNASNFNLADLTIGRWVSLASLPTYVGPDVQLQIVGIVEEIGVTGAVTTYVTRPAEGWRVIVLDDASFGKLQGASPSVLDNRLAL